MIDKDEVIRIHNVVIDEFGGSKGIPPLVQVFIIALQSATRLS
jgi:hypothetical protein